MDIFIQSAFAAYIFSMGDPSGSLSPGQCWRLAHGEMKPLTLAESALELQRRTRYPSKYPLTWGEGTPKMLSHIPEMRRGRRGKEKREKILTPPQEPSRPFSPIFSSAQEVNGTPGEHSLFPSSSPLIFLPLRCLFFQVIKTERLAETFSCCFGDLDNMPEPPHDARFSS